MILSDLLSSFGATVVSETQAPHCGTHFLNFKANEDTLKKICKLALKFNMITSVYLDGYEEISYSISINTDDVEKILNHVS